VRRAPAAAALLSAVAAVAGGCGGSATEPDLVPGGDAARGKELIERYGCGGCHEIGGIEGAGGQVGPSLRGFRGSRFVAGKLPNTPENAVRWIVDPQRISPGTLMPDLGVDEEEARDVVAYLYGH